MGISLDILLTGFRGTSSEALVKRADAKSLILPNDKVLDSQLLIAELDQHSYDYIFSFGQKPNIRDKVYLETTARSAGKYIQTDFAYCKLQNALRAERIAVQISDHAGTSFCNALYWNVLEYIRDKGLKTKMIFVHIPFWKNMTSAEDFMEKILKATENCLAEQRLTYYHGSPIGGLTELKPFLSEHGKPYIYFATNPLVALLYAVKPVPKPFSFYPYGFDRDGHVVYSEYYENAFYDLYKDRVGYLYECDHLKNVDAPTQINCAYTCSEAIKVDRTTKIPDLYAYYKEQEARGLFRVKHRNEISDKEMNFVVGEFIKDMGKYELLKTPQCDMSVFIQRHFPFVWEMQEDKGQFEG